MHCGKMSWLLAGLQEIDLQGRKLPAPHRTGEAAVFNGLLSSTRMCLGSGAVDRTSMPSSFARFLETLSWTVKAKHTPGVTNRKTARAEMFNIVFIVHSLLDVVVRLYEQHAPLVRQPNT